MAILAWGSQSDRWRGITRPHLSQSIFLKTITPPGDSFYHTVTSWNRSRFGSLVIITEVASTIITVHSCYFGIIKFQLGLKLCWYCSWTGLRSITKPIIMIIIWSMTWDRSPYGKFTTAKPTYRPGECYMGYIGRCCCEWYGFQAV